MQDYEAALRGGARGALQRPALRHERSRAYFVGPLARYNLNFDRLTPWPRRRRGTPGSARSAGIRSRASSSGPWSASTPCEEALRIIESLRDAGSRPCVDLAPKAGDGLRRHRSAARTSAITATSSTSTARSSTPRSCRPPRRTRRSSRPICVNSWQRISTEPEEALTWQCEQAVRNYDPCISCATHFLRVTVERS